MRIGTVFRWKNYPYPFDGEVKARWFVYLGRSSSFLMLLFARICTTTTQINHFKPDGKRKKHAFVKIKSGYYGFESDCILDLDSITTEVEERLLQDNPDIEIKGQITEDLLRKIYDKIRDSKYISKKIKIEIYHSYNRDEIYDLKQPK